MRRNRIMSLISTAVAAVMTVALVPAAAAGENTISGERLLDADVSNEINQIGTVRNVVLNEDATAVEYVLFEVGYPYTMPGRDGYLPFDSIAVQQQIDGFGLDIAYEQEADRAPQTLKLTRTEADHRLLSNILGDPVHFADEQSRLIEDVLIDGKTGRLTHYVVNKNPDSLFNTEPRAIPAREVAVNEQGNVQTTTEFAALERIE